ncbi:hypothetical protein NC653_013270 [Populus alba x Populus x berolinensis]|uniref:J domain-containing protein n=1 Tax=Populus alba x Populus x berolinensis TaxID=444605 RepID=A0AAD6QUB9_9ROSI|nr:hypothetical protein NC653_013270 [Populus alba x Populus x berolinensis]
MSGATLFTVVNGRVELFVQGICFTGQMNARFDEIKKAYRSMALQYHPDACTPSARSEESTKRFVEQ